MSAVTLNFLNLKISIFMISVTFLLPGENLTKTLPSFCFNAPHRPCWSCVSQTCNMRLTTFSKLPNCFPTFPQKSLYRHRFPLALYTNDDTLVTVNHHFILPKLWLITALLILLLPITDLSCSRGNGDAENSYWIAPRNKYYYKQSTYEGRISALGYTEMDFWNLLTGLTQDYAKLYFSKGAGEVH